MATLYSDLSRFEKHSSTKVDEGERHDRLNDLHDTFRQQVDRHQGQVVRRVGHSFVVQFPTAEAAVRCGLDLQNIYSRQNWLVKPGLRVEPRITVQFAPVVRKPGQTAQEVVRRAAALESFTPDSSVCVPQAVLEKIRGKVRAKVTDLGPHRLPKVLEPVLLYALVPARSVFQ